MENPSTAPSASPFPYTGSSKADRPSGWKPNVDADNNGRDTVPVGSAHRQGLPADLFAAGEAKWLGVQAQGQVEQPRIMLLSVPYAMKAADAQTLEGLPASAFVLASPGSGASSTPPVATSASGTALPPVSGSGTADYIPLWTDNSGTLGNSILFQLGSGSSARIGVNLKNPLATLDVNGTAAIRGTLEPITSGIATASKGFNSYPLDLEASSFSSTTHKAVMQHFEWRAEPTGNNTNKPGATLSLLFGQDPNTPAETGLSLSDTGLFTFAAGQEFPGTGTVTSVGLSAPSSDFTVSGSPITKSGSISLDWTLAPTSGYEANTIVKRDAGGGFSAGSTEFFTSIAGNAAMTATDDSGSATTAAAYGKSVNGTGVVGQSTNGAGVSGSGSDGVDALGTNYGVYGRGGTGVLGETYSTVGNGLSGINYGGANGLYTYTSSILGASAYLDGPTGHCAIYGNGSLFCTGSKSAVVPVDGGSRQAALYAMDSPENWFEDFGFGRLTNGEATIQLESKFAQTVNTGMDYHVFAVPNGDCKGLYVAEKTAAGFVVRELGGGTSNIAFDYRIVARRKGYENIRLADKTEEFTAKPKPPSPPLRQPSSLKTLERSAAEHLVPGIQSR